MTGVTQIIENKHTYNDPKTFFKDFKESDDEPAAQNATRNATPDATADTVQGVVEKALNALSKKKDRKKFESRR